MRRAAAAAVLALGAAARESIPQPVADQYGAKCPNGSPPTYDITRNVSSAKWVLFLEGGGWHFYTEGRLRVDPGWWSAAGAGGADIGGIMAQDPTVNPDFYEWNKVFIHYCDGSSMGSGRTEPYQGTQWQRGRNNFNAVIGYLQQTLGMGNATEVILSGGSAGGLAVFYNLDHLATLLPKGVRLTGFPDAGFFLDAANTGGTHAYRASFQNSDPVWNVTASGGTNLRCLAGNKGSEWKCLMAPYIAPYIETPIFVMNSAYDAWQMGNILHAACIPTPSRPCTAEQNATLTSYRDQFVNNITAVTSGKPRNGVYVDSCYVHEQNVNYCSGQGMPNCVGWTPAESGSKKWGYATSVRTADGRALTPQQAFSAYYFGAKDAVLVDSTRTLDNPSCHYLGKPAPPKPAPTPPPGPPGSCANFSGAWIDDPHWFTPVVFTQTGCAGSFQTSTYTVAGDTMHTSTDFHGGLTGVLKLGSPRDTITWSNGYTWERNHSSAAYM